jgi:hypothetical protein
VSSVGGASQIFDEFEVRHPFPSALVLTGEEDPGEVRDLWDKIVAGSGFQPRRGVSHEYAFPEHGGPPLTFYALHDLLQHAHAAGNPYGIVLVDG